jgi:hypothetical protein
MQLYVLEAAMSSSLLMAAPFFVASDVSSHLNPSTQQNSP